ncbi:MAG TPA: hypothetical protein VEA38_09650 [Terriglobales bacterium]|nr:hypothetical protein [Terriglobales bacterium]
MSALEETARGTRAALSFACIALGFPGGAAELVRPALAGAWAACVAAWRRLRGRAC